MTVSRGEGRVDGSVTKPEIPRLLPSDWVWAITEDREGSLWVATEKGAARLVDDRFVPYVHNASLADTFVTGLVFDTSNRVWIGTRKALVRVHGDRAETVLELPVLSMGRDGRGRVMVATTRRVFVFEDDREIGDMGVIGTKSISSGIQCCFSG